MTVHDPSKKWTHPVPVWASRPDGDNFIASFTAPLWLFLLIGLMLQLNLLVWSGIGIYEAARLILS